MTCLDDAHLQALLEGTLAPRDMARLDAHVDVCAECRALVSDLMQVRAPTSSGAAPGEPRSIAAGLPAGRRYVVLDLLGRGGMGRVHRAVDRLTGRTVALKRVLRGAAQERSAVAAGDLEALAREFRILATLRHPNIISVLDYGFDAERRPYVVMELLADAQPLLPFACSAPRATQVELLIQLLRALGYLHRRGVLHRDLKPSNLLVVEGAEGPTLEVLDFGLSVGRDETRREHAVGTLPYMAPELFRGDAASEASDLYAVGVVAYEMLVGHRPFRAGREPAETIAEVLGVEPDLTPLPPALRAPIGRALCKSPSGRPPDAATLLEELAAAAGATIAREPSRARDSHLVAARFTGRDEELARLRGALDAARARRGSAWLVGGESGSGKSRLLDELCSSALCDGVLAVRGQALSGAGTAYHVWHRVLELLALHVELSPMEAGVLGALVPNLSALLDRDVAPPEELGVEVARLRLQHVLREVVERSRDPVLVLLEDLQWADAESLLLLAQIADDVATLPLLVVGSYRDDEAPALPTSLPAMQVLRLAPFDRSGVARLCEAMLGAAGTETSLVDLVARETAGNAYNVIEVMRALAEESGGLAGIGRTCLPEQILAGGMEQIFERRLARVPPEARPLLRIAAVAGRQLDLDVLSRCAPRLEALLHACVGVGVLEAHEQRFRFSHDKLRERVLRALDAAEERALHARVADAIEAAYPGSDLHAARLAHHHRAAGRLVEAARCYARAGEAALTRGAPVEAQAAFEQARLLHREVGAPLLAEARVWRGLTEARYALGRFVETDEALRALCALAGAPLPADAVGLRPAIAREIAEQIARRAGLARVLGPRTETEVALAGQVLVGLSASEVYFWLVEPELLLLCTLRGLNLEEALGAGQRTNFFAATAFVLSHTPLRGLAARYLERALATSAPGTHGEIAHQRFRALIELNGGRWAEAESAAARAVACARSFQDNHSLMKSLLQLYLARAELDDYAGVLECCHEVERLAARTRNPLYTALALLGQANAWFRIGDLPRTEALLERALESLPDDLGPVLEAIVVGFLAACAYQQGRQERAEILAARAMDATRRVGGTIAELRYAFACVLDVYLGAEHPERHEAQIRHALTELHRIARRFRFAEPNAWMLEGRYEHARGRPARAAAALRRSALIADQLGSRYQHAQARFWLGSVARSSAGRRHVPEGAAVHFESALRLFDHLGCAWEAARVRAAMQV